MTSKPLSPLDQLKITLVNHIAETVSKGQIIEATQLANLLSILPATSRLETNNDWSDIDFALASTGTTTKGDKVITTRSFEEQVTKAVGDQCTKQLSEQAAKEFNEKEFKTAKPQNTEALHTGHWVQQATLQDDDIDNFVDDLTGGQCQLRKAPKVEAPLPDEKTSHGTGVVGFLLYEPAPGETGFVTITTNFAQTILSAVEARLGNTEPFKELERAIRRYNLIRYNDCKNKS